MAAPISILELDTKSVTVLVDALHAIAATGWGTVLFEVKDNQITDWKVEVTGKCEREVNAK